MKSLRLHNLKGKVADGVPQPVCNEQRATKRATELVGLTEFTRVLKTMRLWTRLDGAPLPRLYSALEALGEKTALFDLTTVTCTVMDSRLVPSPRA